MKEMLSSSSASITMIILAAGRSTRFGLRTSKLAFPVCGRALVLYPLTIAQKLTLPTLVVTGYQKELITQLIHDNSSGNVVCIEQSEQRGTGHAVLCALTHVSTDYVLIMNGDMPLVTSSLIQELIELQKKDDATIAFVIAECPDADHSYGTVVEQQGSVAIVEARDLKGAAPGRTINAGIYLIEKNFLNRAMKDLMTHENHEIYITDIIARASAAREKISMLTADYTLVRGINTMYELAAAEKIMRRSYIDEWMKKGVYFENPETTIIDYDVTIGQGSRIGSGVHLLHGSSIGDYSVIGHDSTIESSHIADEVTIRPYCVISRSEIYDQAIIGPFAHLRDVHSVHEKGTIGNFVEVSNSTIGASSKAKHLAYIGNATIGQMVNIGAGTITCNYDGVRKNITVIEDHVKVGSNNSLVAPVTLGRHAMTGAGSVITEDIPPFALGIARTHQINKEHYVHRLNEPKSFIGAVKTGTTEPSEKK